jgi:peptidyl-prolyl cis-trans isomerase C
VKKEVLNRLIDFELMLQDAKKRGIVVDETIITSNLDAFKKQFTEENPFSSFLEKNDITEEIMKEQLRKQHTIQKFQGELQKELTAEISVSDDAVKEFYDKNIDKFKKPEQVRASHILISVDPTADKAAAQKALEEIQVIHKQVKEGTDFSELARIKSSCPSSKQGGDLGFFGKGQMVKPFEDAAFALKPGEVSAPVETQFGYHLIKLEEKKEAGTMPFEEVKGRISQYLTQIEIDIALEKYIASLHDKAQITKLIKLD